MDYQTLTTASGTDYQFLKDFIDMMIGIIFLLFILKFTLLGLKYIFSPVLMAVYWLMDLKDRLRVKAKNYVDNYESNINKENNSNQRYYKNSNDNNYTHRKDFNKNTRDNIIDFNKIKKRTK